MYNVIDLLNMHHHFFFSAKRYADMTAQPTPEDSRAWSQILISLLTGINGLGRQKGPDLLDGSDVKAANAWDAIDIPRFNGCIKSGTQSSVSDSMASLDAMPYLFFVLWDNEPLYHQERVRVWVVRTQYDPLFRSICREWYRLRQQGIIKSPNFQLHPPINLDSDLFTNNCGNLEYPLLFAAHWNNGSYEQVYYNPDVLSSGYCSDPR